MDINEDLALLALDDELRLDGYDIDGVYRRAIQRRLLRNANERVTKLAAHTAELFGPPPVTLLDRLKAVDGATTGSIHDYTERLYWSLQPFPESAPYRRWNLYLRARNFFSTVNTLPGTEGLRTMLVAFYDSQTDTEPPQIDHETTEGRPVGFFLYSGPPSADPTQLNNSQPVKVPPTVVAQPKDTEAQS